MLTKSRNHQVGKRQTIGIEPEPLESAISALPLKVREQCPKKENVECIKVTLYITIKYTRK